MNHLFPNCLKPRILHLSCFQGREALTASQVEDFGLQAMLEKTNSFITPPIGGPRWDTSNICPINLIFSRGSSRQKKSTAETAASF